MSNDLFSSIEFSSSTRDVNFFGKQYKSRHFVHKFGEFFFELKVFITILLCMKANSLV